MHDWKRRKEVRDELVPRWGSTKDEKYNTFGPDNKVQCMTFEDEDGKPKGMKQVLIERGLWKNSLLADCKLCKDKVIDENRVDCCARRILSLQPDFVNQKSALEEIILEAGHLCIFTPSFTVN